MSIQFNLAASLLNAGNIAKQFEQQLQNNPALKNALSAAQSGSGSGNAVMDNIANQLASVLKTNNADTGTTPNLLDNTVVNRVLTRLSPSTANRLRGFLGDLDPETASEVADILNKLDTATVNKLVDVVGSLKPADVDKGIRFLKAMFGRDDRVFYQNSNKDLYLNAQNSKKVSGADLDNFMRTAYNVYSRGQDFGKFLDASLEVMEKGDYDDFRRFLSVTDALLYYGEDVTKFYALSSKVLNQPAVAGDYKNYAGHYDYEAVAFGLHTTLLNGGKQDDYLAIANNLKMTGLDGRNNLVDFNRIIVSWRNSGANMPSLFRNMANEAKQADGDVRGWMDDYMALKGLAHTGPDFSKFNRIERIDSPAMVIKKGESAALFAQAISTRDGLLPQSVLYWSSLEQGALSHGSSYLDLSKLDVGVHHICVKIGGYGCGTDTAIKTVIVEPADVEKVKDDNGHGNDPGKVDPSNPGNSKQTPTVTPPPSAPPETKVKDDNGHGNDSGKVDPSNPGNSKQPAATAPPPVTGRGSNRGAVAETAAGPVAPPASQVAEVTPPPVVPLPPAPPPPVVGRGSNRGATAPAAPTPVQARKEAIADTLAAVQAVQSGESLKEISSRLNAKYYKNLDKVSGLNHTYVQDLQKYMSEKREKADEQLNKLLTQLLTALQAV